MYADVQGNLGACGPGKLNISTSYVAGRGTVQLWPKSVYSEAHEERWEPMHFPREGAPLRWAVDVIL